MGTSADFDSSPHSRAHEARTLGGFVALSIALHAVLAIALPELQRAEIVIRDPLQVTLEKREPARVVPATPAPAAAQNVQRAQKRKSVSRPDVAPRERAAEVEVPAQAPLLALPQPAAEGQGERAPVSLAPEPLRQPAVQGAPARERARAAPVPGPVEPPRLTPPISDAAYLHNPQPRYPIVARRRGEQGTVVVKVLVTTDGRASNASVQASSGSTRLDEAALEAVRSWRFVPARRGTQAVEAWHLVPIVFRLEGTS